MKKILSVVLIIFIVFCLSGCKKDISKLSYVTYNNYFEEKDGYTIVDHSFNEDTDVIRNIEAGNGRIQFFYIEYKTDKYANDYIKENYNEKGYKTKKYNNYTYIKGTKGIYFKLYKIDNVIVYGMSENKADSFKINKIFKDLGF